MWVRFTKKDGQQVNGVIPTTNLLKIWDSGVMWLERRSATSGTEPVIEAYAREDLSSIKVLGVIGHGAEAFMPGKRKRRTP